MADEVEDQRIKAEEACKPGCAKAWVAYQDCAERISKMDASGEVKPHCKGQYFDFWKCMDKCTAPKLFAALK